MTKQHVLMGFMQVIHQSNVGKPLRISMGIGLVHSSQLLESFLDPVYP